MGDFRDLPLLSEAPSAARMPQVADHNIWWPNRVVNHIFCCCRFFSTPGIGRVQAPCHGRVVSGPVRLGICIMWGVFGDLGKSAGGSMCMGDR